MPKNRRKVEVHFSLTNLVVEVAIVVQVVLSVEDELTVVTVDHIARALAVVVPADVFVRGQVLGAVVAVVVSQLVLVVVVVADDLLALGALNLQL